MVKPDVSKQNIAEKARKVAHDNSQPIKQAQVVKKVIEKKQDPKVAVAKKADDQGVKEVPRKPVANQPVARQPASKEPEDEQPIVPKKSAAKQVEDEKKQPTQHYDKNKDTDNTEENPDDENKGKGKGEEDNETHVETNEVEGHKPAANKKGLGVGKVLKKQGQTEGKSYKLAKDARCAEDVKQLCSSLPKDNNFAILVCLQDAAVVSCTFSLLLHTHVIYFIHLSF